MSWFHDKQKFNPMWIIFENDLRHVFTVEYQKSSSMFFIFADEMIFTFF